MPTVIKRCISLLLILMLVVSLIPSVYAAETADEADPAASTETMEETTNTEPEENLIPPPDETESPVTEESVTEPSELDIIDDSEPPVMLLIDGEVALASISNCQATTWATIWVNTDEYSPIAGKYHHLSMKGKINMKKLTKILSLLLVLTLMLSFPVGASAAELEDAPIDESRTGSLTIYKYDLTNAEKDGVWDSSYVSTGVFDQTGVNDVLGGGESALGNGETGYGYAIKGVEFSYVQVADIVQFSESENDSRTDSHVEILYAIDKIKGADFLKALNLTDGKNRYTNADALDEAKYYYQSDVLIDALAAALETNSTVVKNALEAYISANGGAAMPLTDAYGKTKAENLNLGLYLVVETKVPEMVVSTTDPFLVSVPMTSVNGTNATDGGTRWIYDITLYPKNLTGIPSLEKTLRENKNDTGKTDAYAHTGTASAGDTVDYQIISTLPYGFLKPHSETENQS